MRVAAPLAALFLSGFVAPLVSPAGSTGIPGYPCYRTVQETYDALGAIATEYPHLATLIDIGDSWEKTLDPTGGHDLIVLRLTSDATPGPKPRLFVSGGMHPRELAPAELALRFAEMLASRYGADPDVTWMLDHQEIHVLALANPDGRIKAEQGLSWRKNTDAAYCDLADEHGADLNRNFPYAWGCCFGSSGVECNEQYRGPNPASEPETQAIEAYLTALFPAPHVPGGLSGPDASGMLVDLHAYGALVLRPWGFNGTPPDVDALRRLGRKLAYFNGYKPEPAYALYVTDGTAIDFAYGQLGIAAYVFEMGGTFADICPTFEGRIAPENLAALLYAARVARAPFALPAGPDAVEVDVRPHQVAPGTRVLVTAVVDDTRFSRVNGQEPSQPIAAAEAFVDRPPWTDGSSPIPLAATDGAFDTSVETVNGIVDTSGLSLGRHLLFVRGRDADGNLGPVTAVFLEVSVPGTADAPSLLAMAAAAAACIAWVCFSRPGRRAIRADARSASGLDEKERKGGRE
jgi:carboxypeptidase T